jgi:hypothetical protein
MSKQVDVTAELGALTTKARRMLLTGIAALTGKIK